MKESYILIFITLLSLIVITSILVLFLRAKLEKLFRLMMDREYHNKEEATKAYFTSYERISSDINRLIMNQNSLLNSFSERLDRLTESIYNKLKDITSSNNSQLEKIRETVGEKLEVALEKRLGDSFNIVSNRLEKVHKGLGEMQSLAKGVGDLKKVLTNVKLRGTWGELHLDSILSQFLSSEQYKRSVAINSTRDRVDFAIIIPSKDRDMLLPIDSKFPLEDYSKAEDDKDLSKIASKIRAEAKSISTKYINVPLTTDFAIMFLPIESLFSYVLSLPGLAEEIQSKYRVILAGPSTLVAILNSIRLGFQTLAIQKHSGEVWQLLKSVKSEFANFGLLLEKSHKKILEAGDAISNVTKSSNKISKKVIDIEDYSKSIENISQKNI